MIGVSEKPGLAARLASLGRWGAQWQGLFVPNRPGSNAAKVAEAEMRRLFELAPHLLQDVGFVPDAAGSNQYQTVYRRGDQVLILGNNVIVE